VNRQEVAEALEEIGLLLDLRGENPFKTRAYHNGARVLKSLDRDLAELVRTGEIRSVAGIGSTLAEKITTLVRTGALPYVADLRSQISAGLLEHLRARRARAGGRPNPRDRA